jgi:hypothetical protein
LKISEAYPGGELVLAMFREDYFGEIGRSAGKRTATCTLDHASHLHLLRIFA